MSETSIERPVTIAGQRFVLRTRDVRSTMRRVEPEPITSHYVVIDARRFPPKQVIGAVTGLDRADFTTHQARRTLRRLGFAAGRKEATTAHRGSTGEAGPGLADQLRPLAGQWVAVRADGVLHAAATAQELVGWLSRHDQRADSMFRVPEDETAGTGLAPL